MDKKKNKDQARKSKKNFYYLGVPTSGIDTVECTLTVVLPEGRQVLITFQPTPVRLESVLDRMHWTSFLRELPFYPVSIIPKVHHNRILFTYR
jgi:hypothetical protein